MVWDGDIGPEVLVHVLLEARVPPTHRLDVHGTTAELLVEKERHGWVEVEEWKMGVRGRKEWSTTSMSLSIAGNLPAKSPVM